MTKRVVVRKSHAKKPVTRRAKANTEQVMPRLQSRLTQETRPNVASGGEGEWPTDVPANLEVERVMQVGKEFEGRFFDALLGHIIHMDLYTMGVGTGTKVQVRLYRDPRGFSIFVDGEEVFKWMLNPDDLPVKFKEFIEEKGRIDNTWAEGMELDPDDFVEEGDDGPPVITRAKRGRKPRATVSKKEAPRGRPDTLRNTSPSTGGITWE